MKIEYFGHSCFRLTTKSGLRILTDPFTNVGYELPPDLSADVVLCSHKHFDHDYVQGVQAERVIDKTGEYDVKGVKITGYLSYHDEVRGAKRGENILFVVEADGLRICHAGDFGEESVSAYKEKLGKLDLLFLPVGGTYTIDGGKAKEVVEELSPKKVIPMHFKTAESTIDIAGAGGFLSLFPEEEKSDVFQGVWEYDFGTKKIIRMERKKA